MDNQDNEFDKIENAAADKRRQQDIDDLNNELSGNDVGRTARFLSPDVRERLLEQKQGQPSRAMSALEMALMSNPAYAAIHKAAVDETRAAQRTAQTFQDDVDVAFADVRADIARMLDEAVTLPDGSKAFMGKDGVAWTVDGKRVDDAITAGIDWSGRPTREDYHELLAQEETLENASQQGRQLSNRLGEIYNELHDEDDPPSSDQLDSYRLEVQDIETEYNRMGREIQVIVDVEREFQSSVSAIAPNAVPEL